MKTTTWHILLILAVLAGAPVMYAQDQDPPDRSHGAAGAGREGDLAQQERHQALKRYLNHLSRTNPELHDELQELRQTDKRAFARRLFELRQEHFRKYGRNQERAETSDRPRERPADLHQEHPREKVARMGLHSKFMDELRQEDPERYQQLEQLLREDPKAFREELRKVFDDRVRSYLRQNFATDDAQAKRLARKYRETTDEAQREAIRQELRQVLDQSFSARQQQLEDAVAKMRQRLDEAEAKLTERAAQRGEMVDKRLQLLLEGKDDHAERTAEDGDSPRRRPSQPRFRD